jgi:hypothetical protein
MQKSFRRSSTGEIFALMASQGENSSKDIPSAADEYFLELM